MSQSQEGAVMSSDQPRPQTPSRTAPEQPQSGSKNESESDSRARNDGMPRHLLNSPGRRTSSNIELLMIEAELVGEGKELDNPAIPSDKVIETVLDRIDSRDLQPAWIAMRGGEE